ncbi:uncharacterized protein MELLADRAFT_84756 [Melampsora larici-populina 98AG31]|uniref:Uncharacterized protein n=1 Tax=Melampsora larici-populina (strain 98AG31 / pathotype 3-4-7) TaxID=747676 RepID=F4RG61_MELLP|nr:uncharacterized protein MELLADRAFT_84756 [Melampsora larici-populina 98AG31]EGG08602.1 hypothetical protein MELLADRAFT_84756 [Melampsora larici-populina 98AG31]
MNPQSTSTSCFQGPSLPFPPLCAKRVLYDTRSLYDQQVLSRFNALPTRHRVEEGTLARPMESIAHGPIRQPAASTSHHLEMHGNMVDEQVDDLHDAIVLGGSAPTEIGSIARRLAYEIPSRPNQHSLIFVKDHDEAQPFHLSAQSTSRAFYRTSAVASTSQLDVTSYSVPHNMIDWKREDYAAASALPFDPESEVACSTDSNHTKNRHSSGQGVRRHSRGARSQKPNPQSRLPLCRPKHSERTTHHSSGVEADVDEPGRERQNSVDVLRSMLPADTVLRVGSRFVTYDSHSDHPELPQLCWMVGRPLLRDPCERFVKKVMRMRLGDLKD